MILSITNHSSYFRNASLRTTKGQNGVGIYIIEHCVLSLFIISTFFFMERKGFVPRYFLKRIMLDDLTL